MRNTHLPTHAPKTGKMNERRIYHPRGRWITVDGRLYDVVYMDAKTTDINTEGCLWLNLYYIGGTDGQDKITIGSHNANTIRRLLRES